MDLETEDTLEASIDIKTLILTTSNLITMPHQISNPTYIPYNQSMSQYSQYQAQNPTRPNYDISPQ